MIWNRCSRFYWKSHQRWAVFLFTAIIGGHGDRYRQCLMDVMILWCEAVDHWQLCCYSNLSAVKWNIELNVFSVLALWIFMLRVQSMSNNAKGNKRVICFRYSFVAMVILILSYKRGISLHVPLPMNVANARYHSLLGDAISFLVSNSSR